jgi:hypothetical protein
MTSHPARCIDPGAITADDLIAHARGEAGPAAVAHVERCPACRARAAAYAEAEQRLHARLFRRTCPPTVRIGEYCLGILPAEAMQHVAEHLLDCPHCLAEQRAMSAYLRAPDEPEPERGLAGTLRRLFARPERPETAARAALRGDEAEESVSFSAGDVRLTLSVQRSGRGTGRVIAGLFDPAAGQNVTGAVAHLYEGDRLVQIQRVDDLGGFMFVAVPAGAYRVEIAIPAGLVVIDPVTVT